MQYILGIDIGTSSAKASLFCENGTLVSSGTDSYETYYPGKLHVEQDPEQWWTATVNAINQVFLGFKINTGDSIAGLSISSQSPSLVALDKHGQVIRPAMIWMDRRAESECEWIVNEIIGIDRYQDILGNKPDAFYTLPKLMWYRKNEPENFKKTAMILQANGYIAYKLTGVYSIDTFQAINVQAMDHKTKTWSGELSNLLDISFDEILPKISKATDVIGTVTQKAASATGIKEGTPVVAGITDSMAAIFGMGLFSPGSSCEITGTSTLVCIASETALSNGGSLQIKPSIVPGIGSYLVAPISSTGASVKWCADLLGLNENANNTSQIDIDYMYNEINREAKNAICGSRGLFFFPYLTGERAPLWNSYSKGMFIGLTLKTEKKDIIRAVYEGTSYAVRHVYDEAKKIGCVPNVIYSGGGGSKSDIWLNIKASVLDRELLVPDGNADNSVRGNAVIAGIASGLYSDIHDAGEGIIKIKKTIEPNPTWVKTYNELYPYYRSLYTSLEPDLIRLEKTIFHLDTLQP